MLGSNYKLFRWLLMVALMLTMNGCFYWWRAYQTYQQMDDFDRHFAISVKDDFTIHFKDPVLISDDFVSLAKLTPSEEFKKGGGKLWRYWFRKVDQNGAVIEPEIKFSFMLSFAADDKVSTWTFSPLFLQIAPAEFLELSIRSIAKGEILQQKRQLKVDTSQIDKISAQLPLKPVVLKHLGEPLTVEDTGEEQVYIYHFVLETDNIEQGYEERALSIVKLTFNKAHKELVKMSGRFAGLKVAIDYRKYQQKQLTKEI